MLPLQYKPMEEIEEADLKFIVDNALPESKRLEFKRELVGQSPTNRKEFCADVSSFANTLGGHIILGIEQAKDGTAKSTWPIQSNDPDSDIRRMEQIILSGIEPRIPSISFREIEMARGDYIFVIRIPPSWNAPHMVTQNGKFFRRHSKGKDPMDVYEIRDAFMISEKRMSQALDFRERRIEKHRKTHLPHKLDEGPRVYLHLIPIAAFGKHEILDLETVVKNRELLEPIHPSGFDFGYNLEGYFAYIPYRGYVQYFRNGSIESARIIHTKEYRDGEFFDGKHLEEGIQDAVHRYLALFRKMSIPLPVFVMLSLIDVEGYRIGYGEARFQEYRQGHASKRNDILLPETIIDSYDSSPEEILKSIFDTMWNAFGVAKSPHT